jgi:hypothetical protein
VWIIHVFNDHERFPPKRFHSSQVSLRTLPRRCSTCVDRVVNFRKGLVASSQIGSIRRHFESVARRGVFDSDQPTYLPRRRSACHVQLEADGDLAVSNLYPGRQGVDLELELLFCCLWCGGSLIRPLSCQGQGHTGFSCIWCIFGSAEHNRWIGYWDNLYKTVGRMRGE